MPLEQVTIFISHALVDADFAACMGYDLVAHHMFVQIQSSYMNDDEISRAIDTCDIYIVILSVDTLLAPGVMQATRRAIDNGKAIIPVIRGTYNLPLGLAHRQAIMFSLDYSDNKEKVTELLQAIQRHIMTVSLSRKGIFMTIALLVVSALWFLLQDQFVFWEILVGTATIGATAKNSAARLGRRMAHATMLIFNGISQLTCVGMLFLAGFWAESVFTPKPDSLIALVTGALIGAGAGVILILEFVFIGAAPPSKLRYAIERLVVFLDFFTQFAKVFSVIIEAVIWCVGGAACGVLGALLAQSLR